MTLKESYLRGKSKTAYQNDELSKEATRYMDMLTKKVGVEDGDVNLKDPGYIRIGSDFEDKDSDGIPDMIDADSGGERLNINIGGEEGEVVEEEKKEE